MSWKNNDRSHHATAEDKCVVGTVLESSGTHLYTPVLRSVPPGICLSAASFERGSMGLKS